MMINPTELTVSELKIDKYDIWRRAGGRGRGNGSLCDDLGPRPRDGLAGTTLALTGNTTAVPGERASERRASHQCGISLLDRNRNRISDRKGKKLMGGEVEQDGSERGWQRGASTTGSHIH
ncbi:hypothetical protein EVAR_64190_1 [Eumeta japonica]|uniref:Uncharacterized protein n=1 Tax=Eumeta variegata TaxID=151549 RepID=A0A4C1ZEP8_EUMVA|nr:hypothetical protein EVAR_64190_1 [Eumeta japonica]